MFHVIISNIYNSELVKEGWSIFRADRCNRSGGGAAIYIKSDFIVTDILSSSTDMCEAIALYLPSHNLAVINIYRPPSCRTEDFQITIHKINTWLSDIENKYKTTPTIILTGDMNFPLMKSWDHSEITNFFRKYIRESNDSHIGTIKLQTKFLSEFTQDHYLNQFITGATRKTCWT